MNSSIELPRHEMIEDLNNGFISEEMDITISDSEIENFYLEVTSELEEQEEDNNLSESVKQVGDELNSKINLTSDDNKSLAINCKNLCKTLMKPIADKIIKKLMKRKNLTNKKTYLDAIKMSPKELPKKLIEQKGTNRYIKKTVTFKLVDKHLESIHFIDINPSEYDNSETNSFRNFGDLVYYNV